MTNNTAIDFDKIKGITLVNGHHNIEATGTGCAMDAIAWAATGEITDMPSCVHPVLTKKVQALNDAERCTNADRWRLVRDGGPILVGSSEWEAKRACLVIADAGRTVDGFLSALRYAADLSFADLSFADLSFADLSSADLSIADLRSADLRFADLSFANLRSADLSAADLRSADLRSADLRSANLRFADLSSADLSSADLSSADLSSARFDRLTVWPDGFDAAAAGAVEETP